MGARHGEWPDSIIAATPLSRWVLTLSAVAPIATLRPLVFGHHTHRETVVDQLVPSAGTVNKLSFGLGRAAMTRIAATLAPENEFTAFANQLTKRAAGLIGKWMDFTC